VFYDIKELGALKTRQFVGATDSAMSCALMLDLAEALDPLLNSRFERLESGLEDDEDVSETTLQLVFFDGEEAFRDWTETDSIYGARLTFLSLRCVDVRRLISPRQGI